MRPGVHGGLLGADVVSHLCRLLPPHPLPFLLKGMEWLDILVLVAAVITTVPSLIALLGFWLRCYPITEDVFATGLTICIGCWLFLLLIFTEMICNKITNISITLEILLIAFTVCMHVLRFAAQDLFVLNWVRLIIAALGCIPGAVTLLRLHELFSKPPVVLVDLIIEGHILFKTATIINSLFRLLDVIFISIAATRVNANYLQGRLQECFH
ncbi:hypothetical protein ZWY2020_005235 [Hordeum vulgare]|nr:hypothetical protein ZWY2020_005235 [Hordeum vulgare]